MGDPNQPKRPLSGFFRFAATVRPQLEKETGLKGTKVAGLIAKQWNELAESEKVVFKQQFHDEMVGHKKRMEEYKKTESYATFRASKKKSKAQKEKRKIKRKMKKDPNRPKQPPSSYFMFANEVRAQLIPELGKSNLGAIGKKTGEMWRELSEEKKQKYITESQKQREIYKKKMAAYKASPEFAEHAKKLAQKRNPRSKRRAEEERCKCQ